MSAVASDFGACPDCLRRSWLLARLAPFIERSCDDRAGRRVPELLALENEDLVRAVAPRRVDENLSFLDSVDEETMASSLAESECWAFCRHHSAWPSGLRHQADAPRCLIGRGDPARVAGLTPDEAATIVGARRATSYGTGVARRLGSEVARAGLAVVSGMALGIDGEVHRGSLGRGRAIAVLGSAADTPYPAANRGLYRDLVERGVVVSEMPPGTGPRRWSFPARNRTMASLSGITVVVEAARRSGSLITAEMALSSGREVGAVPGPVASEVSRGCHDLIRSGAALIRDGLDVCEALGPGVGRRAVASEPSLGDDERAVLGAVSAGATTPDEVVVSTGIEIGAVMLAVTSLEADELIEVDLSGRMIALDAGFVFDSEAADDGSGYPDPIPGNRK